MSALRFLAAALQRLVDRMDPQEGRYRMLFEHSPLPMWVVEAKTLRFLGVNEAATRLYGYTREEFLSMTAEHMRPPEDRAAFRDFLRRESGQVIRGTFRHLKKDGAAIDVEGVGHLVVWRGHSARLVMLNDVSERNRTQQELERLNRELEDRVRSRTEQLEAANKELEAFSYSVSHDLRAPVRHIDGFVKLLEREHPPASDKAAHYLRTIAASSRRMAALIDDLLALSRTGRAPLEMRTVQLAALVDEVIVDLRPDVARRRVEWKVGELPAVRGDPSLLRVVLQNLLDNAVKYTKLQPRALVEIGAHCMLANGCFNVTRYFKMLPGNPTFVQNPVWLENVQSVTSNANGIFYPLVRRGTYVQKGMKIGFLTDYVDRPLADFVAPVAGVITFIRAVPSMTKGETVASIGIVAAKSPSD